MKNLTLQNELSETVSYCFLHQSKKKSRIGKTRCHRLLNDEH